MSNRAEIHFTKEGPVPLVELIVPFGTRLADTFKVQELISREVISKLSPRGCEACNSGVNFSIRERLENVLFVDLETNEIIR